MRHVIFIGPDYKEHRGGIGAILETYSSHISPFRFIPTYNNRSALQRFILYARALFRLTWLLITDRNIRIVHIHTASKGSFIRKSIMLMISKAFRKKVIFHVHSAMFHVYYDNAGIIRPYIRFIFRKADVVIALSQKWNDYFASAFKTKRLFILNNVIERPVVIHKTEESNGPVHLLFLGMIGSRKGIFDLLEVLKQNRELFSDKLILTIGGNGETQRLEAFIRKNELGHQINFTGWTTGARKAELLNQCDIYILPSYHEGLPISVLEAMAYGKPIISTTIGGIPEIVRPGYNGWLFEPGDLVQLTSILTMVLKNKKLLQLYGASSYRLAEKYTPESVMRSLDELYKSLG